MYQIQILPTIILLLAIQQVGAQNTMKGRTQVNSGIGFSDIGIPVYVGLDYGIQPDLSVGGEVSFRSHTSSNTRATLIGLTACMNYHFNSLLQFKDNQWDVYAGATVGYWIWNWENVYPGADASGVGLNFQVGGRYFFDSKWAANMEIGGGRWSGGKIGITYRL